MTFDVQSKKSESARPLPKQALKRVCDGTTPCSDVQQLVENISDPMTVIRTVDEALPGTLSKENLNPVRALVALDEPEAALGQYERTENTDLKRTLVCSWIEARQKDRALSGQLGAIMNERYDPEEVHWHTMHQQPGGKYQREFLEEELEGEADPEAVDKLLEVFRPGPVEIAALIKNDFIDRAREELARTQPFDPARPSRIPSQRGPAIGAFRPLSADGEACDLDLLFETPEQLHLLLERARPEREYSPSILQCLIEYGDPETFDRYAPVALEGAENLHSLIAALGLIEYQMDEQYDQARAILRYLKDRNAITPTALRSAARHQLTGEQPDERLLGLLYDFGLSLRDRDLRQSNGDKRGGRTLGESPDQSRYYYTGLTSAVARTIIKRQPLTTEQHRLLADQIMLDENETSLIDVFQGQRLFGCQKQYEQMLANHARCFDREKLRVIARDWADNPDVKLVGADLIASCFRWIDLAGDSDDRDLATTLFIEAGWKPADGDHVRSLYETLLEYFDQPSAPGKIAALGRKLIQMGALPEREQLQQFEPFVRERLVEAMTGRQKTALNLQDQVS